jgi:hypothetical protein
VLEWGGTADINKSGSEWDLAPPAACSLLQAVPSTASLLGGPPPQRGCGTPF